MNLLKQYNNMKTISKTIVLSLFILSLFSCTENQRARNLGGTAKVKIPCNQKVTNITWKEENLWYSTTPMEEGYTPQTHNFREESSFGLMEGNYLLIETKCN